MLSDDEYDFFGDCFLDNDVELADFECEDNPSTKNLTFLLIQAKSIVDDNNITHLEACKKVCKQHTEFRVHDNEYSITDKEKFANFLFSLQRFEMDFQSAIASFNNARQDEIGVNKKSITTHATNAQSSTSLSNGSYVFSYIQSALVMGAKQIPFGRGNSNFL